MTTLFTPTMGFISKKSDLMGYKINPYVTDITWNIQEWSWG